MLKAKTSFCLQPGRLLKTPHRPPSATFSSSASLFFGKFSSASSPQFSPKIFGLTSATLHNNVRPSSLPAIRRGNFSTNLQKTSQEKTQEEKEKTNGEQEQKSQQKSQQENEQEKGKAEAQQDEPAKDDGKIFSWNMLFAASLFAGVAVGYPLIILLNDNFLDDIYYCFYHPLERVRDVSGFWLLFTSFFGGEVWGPKIYHTLGGPILDGLLYPSRDAKTISLYALASVAHLEENLSLEILRDLPSQKLIFKDFYKELAAHKAEKKEISNSTVAAQLSKTEDTKSKDRFDKEDRNEFVSTPHLVSKYLDLWINLVAFDKCRRLALKGYETEVKSKAEFCYFQPKEIQLKAAKFFEALSDTKHEKILNHMQSLSEVIEALNFLSRSDDTEISFYASKALINIYQGKDSDVQSRWKMIVNQRDTFLAKYAEPIAVAASSVAIGLVYPSLKKFLFRMKSITSVRTAGMKAAAGAVLLTGAVGASEFVAKKEKMYTRETEHVFFHFLTSTVELYTIFAVIRFLPHCIIPSFLGEIVGSTVASAYHEYDRQTIHHLLLNRRETDIDLKERELVGFDDEQFDEEFEWMQLIMKLLTATTGAK